MSSAFYDASRLPMRLLFSTVARVRAEGLPHLPRSGGVVLISNHLSMLDPLLLGVLAPRQLHFMAKEELFRIRPLGWYLRQGGTFPVRRGEVDRAALRTAEDLLRAGEVVMLFPEGHRSSDTGAGEAQSGAVLLATRANCPIVPVAITGTEALRLRGGPGDILRRFISRPAVTVRFGAPILLDPARRGGRKAAADMVMRRIIELLPPAYHGIYAAS